MTQWSFTYLHLCMQQYMISIPLSYKLYNNMTFKFFIPKPYRSYAILLYTAVAGSHAQSSMVISGAYAIASAKAYPA